MCPLAWLHSPQGKTFTMIDSASVLVLCFSCPRRKGADRLGGGKQRQGCYLNKSPAESRLLTLCSVKDTFTKRTIMVSPFNLHRHQCCHDYHYYPLHHYHQSQLILKYHHWNKIFYANLAILCCTFRSLKTFTFLLKHSWTLNSQRIKNTLQLIVGMRHRWQ